MIQQAGWGGYLIVQEPPHVAPPEALVGGVRVHGRVGVQVVISMAASPLNGGLPAQQWVASA